MRNGTTTEVGLLGPEDLLALEWRYFGVLDAERREYLDGKCSVGDSTEKMSLANCSLQETFKGCSKHGIERHIVAEVKKGYATCLVPLGGCFWTCRNQS